MKNSGIEWIREIPESWKLIRLQYILKERNEANYPIKTKNILSLTVSQGVVPYSQRAGGGNKAKEDLSAYKVVHEGDIVLNSMNVIAGAVNLSKYYGCVSPVYYMLYNQNAITTKYYNLVFQTEVFQKSLFGLGNGILVKESSNGKLNTIRLRIPMEKLNKLLLPIPPLSEQQAIADFLDDKCAEIDNLSSAINEQIEVLKQYKKSVITEAVTKGLDPNAPMKDSGVEWIGEIPENWEVSRLKYASILINGDRSDNYPSGNDLVDEGIIFLTSNNIHNIELENFKSKYITFEKYNSMRGAKIKINDIIFCLRGSVGQCSINKTETQGTIASSLVVIRPEKVNSSFLNYCLNSKVANFQTDLYTNGSCAANLSAEVVNNYYFIEPPLFEQQAIANYLEDKCAQIDSVIKDKETQLETLAAYKKSLIYEYVTGKKEVPQLKEV